MRSPLSGKNQCARLSHRGILGVSVSGVSPRLVSPLPVQICASCDRHVRPLLSRGRSKLSSEQCRSSAEDGHCARLMLANKNDTGPDATLYIPRAHLKAPTPA
jgi:hypothetical protein